MKRALLTALFVALAVSAQAGDAQAQGAPESDVKSVTLYGPLARKHDSSRALFSFKTGAFERLDWDLNYGSLYVGEEHDWLQVSTAKGVRTAVRDLGKHKWTDSFDVPVVEPFPELKAGEKRVITVDASGKDGEDGADGANGADGADGANGVTGLQPLPSTGVSHIPEPPPMPRRPRRPKNDGVPKVDPVFVKAVPGHVYVMRIVDAEQDFYVLFRVESLVRGDNCTISWKRVPTPAAESAGRK